MERNCLYCGKEIKDAKRSTKKHCDKICKQMAYYKRHGITGKGKAREILPLSVKRDFTVSGKETEKKDVPNEKEDVNENQAIKKEPELKKISVKPQENKKPYDFIHSRFLSLIEKFREEGCEMKFHYPKDYWSGEALEAVAWITLRFRCILENIIRLSNYASIDQEAISATSFALNSIKESIYFKFLPRDYPFISLISELQSSFVNMANSSEKNEIIPFRISKKRKAELIAARFVIGDSVQKKKFSELNFTDGIQEKAREESQKQLSEKK